MRYPALDVVCDDPDLLYAVVDDYSPTAIEEHDSQLTLFFSSDAHRAGAREAIRTAWPQATVSSRDVDDGDWARRSQENLTPVVVGGVTVTPPWHLPIQRDAFSSDGSRVTVVIQPSMGFGTGHHATTRLCLRALQSIALEGMDLIDVGTGSGVLAIAASLLGARSALGFDHDPDAIASARANLALNPGAKGVRFEVADLNEGLRPGQADVVTANLTGALLERATPSLLAACRPGGVVVASGFLASERRAVLSAFVPARVADDLTEEEWGAFLVRRA